MVLVLLIRPYGLFTVAQAKDLMFAGILGLIGAAICLLLGLLFPWMKVPSSSASATGWQRWASPC
jgi:hypothetical protein